MPYADTSLNVDGRNDDAHQGRQNDNGKDGITSRFQMKNSCPSQN